VELSGGEALAQQLVREGINQMFGVPGVQLDFAVDGLAQVQDDLTFWNTRHEQGAAYMADGYARTTGEPGVCMIVPGPGMLNATAALSTAYACSSPVLAIVGQIPSEHIGKGLGALHEVNDQSHTLGTVTKWTGMALKPSEIPQLVHDALHQVRSGRPAPVGIEIPPDVLEAREEVTLVDADFSRDVVEPDPKRISEAAALLRGAERPLIYVGGGVLAGKASAELRELAEHINVPVVMSLHGRGALDNRHPLAITSLGGRRLVPEADVILVVGSRFLDGHAHVVKTNPQTKLIFLNTEERDLGAPRRADVAIHSDARLGLAALKDSLSAHERSGILVTLDEIRADAQAQVDAVMPQAAWVRALREAIPDDGILVNELTQVGYLSEVGFPVYEPNTYITPGYQGTLGYGFATALGAKAGNPDKVTVSINGDGGFGWNLQELATARKYSIGLVTVVFADNAFGNVRRMQKNRFNRTLATDLVNPDFVKLGEAFGIASERIGSPEALVSAIKNAEKANEPLLLEVPVPELPSAWHLIHDFLPQPTR
jgi:acetolactate synthase-1/2/3 large subunit